MPSLCFGESGTKLNTHPQSWGRDRRKEKITLEDLVQEGGLKAVGFLKLESKTQRGAENTLQTQTDI